MVIHGGIRQKQNSCNDPNTLRIVLILAITDHTFSPIYIADIYKLRAWKTEFHNTNVTRTQYEHKKNIIRI